jgi:hypothetical protein
MKNKSYLAGPARIALASACLWVGMATAQTTAPVTTDVDAHALQATPEVERTPETLAAYLTDGLRTDREKARAIFRWITDRIEYDVASYFSGELRPMDAAQILAKRKAVCDGYSMLFSQLAKLAKLQVKNITGYAKGAPSGRSENAQIPNHVWNAVLIDGRWYALDATWGAGYVDSAGFHHITDDFYFLAPPERLLVSHYAVNDELGVEQAAHLNSSEFIRLPKPPARLMHAGFDGKMALEHARQSGFRSYVQTFDLPYGSFEVIDAPVEYHLAPVPQRLLIHSGTFEQVAVVQGSSFSYFALPGDGNFELSFQPEPGPLYVMGRKPGATEFQALLGYLVGQ